MFPFILPPLWPAPTLLSSPSFPPISPSLPSSPTPVFYHSLSLSLSLWMSCPQITGACGGLSETCVEGWRRLMGSPSSSGSQSFSPKEPKPVVKKKKTSQWVQRQKLIGFLQDIIFHWMDKQEKTSHPKPLSVKYRSQSENWISQPPSPLGSQSSPLRLFLLWFCCSSVWPCLCLTDEHIRDMTCLDFGLSDVIRDDDTKTCS